MSAPADAKFAVGPVFARSKPWLWLSLASPVVHAASVVCDVVVDPSADTFAFVGHPMPSNHCA